MSKKTVFAVVVCILGAVAILTSCQMYYARADNAGTLLWNTNEAYLFMSVARRGYHCTYLRYPLMIFEEYFYAPPSPNDQHVSLTVIRITPSSVDRKVVDFGHDSANVPMFYTPLGENIYAHCPGILCRWTGTHFEAATPEEEQKLGGDNFPSPADFTDLKGWSRRGIGSVTGDHRLSVELGKELTLLVKDGNVYSSPYDSASIELLRPGSAPEELWHVDGRPRRVTEADYKQLFRARGD